jgi:hypothetical protein
VAPSFVQFTALLSPSRRPGLELEHRHPRVLDATQLLDQNGDAAHASDQAVRKGSVAVALGDRDAAFRWLDRAYADRSGLLYDLPMLMPWDPIHNDPRFAALERRVNSEHGVP